MWDGKWKYKAILKHKGPLKKGDDDYKGCMYNLLIEWEDHTITWEPLSNFVQDDPASVAEYAKKNGLTKKDGWRYAPALRRHYRCAKTLIRTAKQAKLQSFRYKPVYMYGYEITPELQTSNGIGRQERKHEMVRRYKT
jgi:hypothetical protein